MSASHGFVQSNDFSFLYDKPVEKKRTNTSSILYVLENEKQYSKFLYLVDLSGMLNYFNDLNSFVTLFIPKNEDIHEDIQNIDEFTAKNIVYYSLVEKKITPQTFQSNSNFYIQTKLNGQRLHFDSELVSDCNEHIVRINNKVIVSGVERSSNAFIIYNVDKLLIPSVMM